MTFHSLATRHGKQMKIVPLAAGFLLALSLAGSARADLDGLGMAYLFGYRNFGGVGFNINNQTPPYFAMHPPVYYGQRYSRPYGVSPFATWPQLQANPAYAPSPYTHRSTVIANPYYGVGGVINSRATPAAVVVSSVDQIEPLVIKNPYFQRQSDVAPGKYTHTQ
jgi:hypothetical protein